MYTRILKRVTYAACALASILPAVASASMSMQAQRLRPPPAFSSPKVAISGAVVSGDWIAVFDRSSGFEGGGQVMLYHHVGKQWDYAQSLAPPDAESCSDSMAMSGDLLFVSCPRAFDQEHGVYMGVVVVYAQSGGQWQPAQTISSATGFYGNPGFGASLAVSGDRLFIGYTGYAPMSDPVVYGDVEVFDLSAGLPATYVMQILPDTSVAYANFGSSLAASNGMLAVGANDANLDGIGDSAGIVYTFESSDGDWVQRSMLTSPHPQAYDSFPSALAFQQLRLVAGSATNGATDADGSLGAAFAYDGSGGELSLADVLMPATAETDTFFGQSLASVGNTVFVGEPNGGTGGHVHVYNSAAPGWTHTSSFMVPTSADGDQFGFDVSSDGKTLVVTALERPESGPGSVYVYDAPPTDQIFGEGSEP